jgi:hypothetical protein
MMRLLVYLQCFLRIHGILDEDLVWQLLSYIFGIKVGISMPTIGLITRICVIDLLVITSAEIIDLARTRNIDLGHPSLRFLGVCPIILIITSASDEWISIR